MVKQIIIGVICIISVAAVVYIGYSDNGQEGKVMDSSNKDIRRAAYAGEWYSNDPVILRNTLSQYLENAKIGQGLGKIIGLISPHAGYMYSGPVAAYAYKQVQGKSYDSIVVIAPNHGDSHLGYSSVYTHGAYQTPLGVIPVDGKTAQAIVDYASSDDVRASDRGHEAPFGVRPEHSLELQLPFLQMVTSNFKLVPIVMGSHNKASCTALAQAIVSAVKGKNTLIVASTDLSHFHDSKTAKKLDSAVQQYVESYDPGGLLDGLASGKCEACGGSPIAVAMMACRELGATKASVLNMATSGDISGDHTSVVGYMAAALCITENSEEKHKVGVDLGLTDSEKEILRNVVKKTLESVVNGGAIPKFGDRSGKLGEDWGAFVTLTKQGNLRGCIGHIVGTQPLILTVAQMARAAALEDSRFPKVTPGELPDIDFEISVLTPIKEIRDINEIQVGRDGIIITRGYNRGLLLPQVATDYGWDRETFLAHTCRKAGLPANAWKQEGTTIEMFSAEVFK
ncbi:MAG: AmmeMemoRadiSam system protein B [Candidatus Latescibacteria bacterium]|nr:AmmeMemoRadiSam system protein B [Candidatus Latescibacterota bacterium]